ncbi:MAG TPA: hypothetical protein VFW65_34755 [Pseudonocardiaceae bacterium]|nr:hypothetical protein [Pseudonocardiaceae bacterium]
MDQLKPRSVEDLERHLTALIVNQRTPGTREVSNRHLAALACLAVLTVVFATANLIILAVGR